VFKKTVSPISMCSQVEQLLDIVRSELLQEPPELDGAQVSVL
jgi:hypothetical protein